MRLERLASDKIKIFLTFDDLRERGISKEEIWMDIPKVHDLFRDMITEASIELGFQTDGPVIVEVFALPSQGMVVIVTITEEEDEDAFDDSFIELQITLDIKEHLIYRFDDIEQVIQLAAECARMEVESGTLYSMDGFYYLLMDEDSEIMDPDNLIALLAEFGETSTITVFRLEEYGKEIIKEKALKVLNEHFK
ncbi:genetic competence negative regulator [Evansella sp. LMS18]|uniref:genetic competence negative regulator n=1 Tax=Evansella sp. LMS18 TaxID=2924033 RepID=UPI0020D16198|nr:genetic competence negative regulator [Evansella sp. LMS18]UTR09599.1 genetic competence negative regulator [Evansella sp. LMS18]